MRKAADKTLRKLDRLELLELLVEQGEQLEHTQEALAAAETRATQQERIARLAEDAISKLAGILEAAQLVHLQYASQLRELKAEMGLKTEAPVNNDELTVDIGQDIPVGKHVSVDAAQVQVDQTETIDNFDAAEFIQNTLGLSTDETTEVLNDLASIDFDVDAVESALEETYASSELPGGW